jgi:hypothetical protein
MPEGVKQITVNGNFCIFWDTPSPDKDVDKLLTNFICLIAGKIVIVICENKI